MCKELNLSHDNDQQLSTCLEMLQASHKCVAFLAYAFSMYAHDFNCLIKDNGIAQ